MATSVQGSPCRCVVPSTTGCLFMLGGECVSYTSTNISGPNIFTGDKFNTVVQKLSSFSTNCCNTKTINYDATQVCTDAFSINPLVTITLVGQSGQGTYIIAVNNSVVSSFNIPSNLTGNFIAFGAGTSGDFIRITLFDASNNQLNTFLVNNVSRYGAGTAFNIALLDHVTLSCQNAE